jgi:hypothetical protein
VEVRKRKDTEKADKWGSIELKSNTKVESFVEVPSPGEYEVTVTVKYLDNKECVKGQCSLSEDLGLVLVKKPRPKLYAIIIGIDSYKDKRDIHPLRFSDDDARSFKRFLMEVLGVPREQIFFLTSDGGDEIDIDKDQWGDFKAGRDNIKKAIHSVKRRVTRDDMVFVYYSGHGFRWRDKWYIVPYDAEIAVPKSRDLYDLYHGRFIIFNDWKDWLRGISAGHVVLIQDSCFSGAVAGDDSFLVREINIGLLDDLDKEKIKNQWNDYWSKFRSESRQALLASLPHEQAYEVYIANNKELKIVTYENIPSDARGHGLFTFALLNAIEQKIGIDLNDDDECGGKPCWNQVDNISDQMKKNKIAIDLKFVYKRLSEFMTQYIDQHKDEMRQKVQHPNYVEHTVGQPLEIVHYHLLQEGR